MSIFQNNQKAEQENEQLLQSIAAAMLELEAAHQNFAYATDPLLVDVYAYQIKAVQAKYSYLLSVARQKQLTKNNYIKHGLQKADL